MAISAAEARRAYKRNWAKNNPDKVKAQQERYWAKRAAEAEQLEKAKAADLESVQQDTTAAAEIPATV